MAEQTDLSRTEPASPRRLQEARAAGDVPRSSELTGWVVLLSALSALAWLAPRLMEGLGDVVESSFLLAGEASLGQLLEGPLLELLLTVLALLAVISIAGVVAPMLLSGWVFSPQAMQVDVRRLSPVGRLTRLLSADAWFDLGRTLLKFVLVAGALAWVLSTGWDSLRGLPLDHAGQAASAVYAWVARGLMAIVGVLAIVAVVDGAWRWWRYLRRHAMTWQEVLAEAREAEGSPEMRARLRQRQQQAGGSSPALQRDEAAASAAAGEARP